MTLANSMNNYPLKNIPHIWLLNRREHLETYYEALDELRDKIIRFSSSRNINAVLDAADSLDQLEHQMNLMEDVLATYYAASDDYNPYNKNEIERIRELAITTSYQLKAIATQISWGMPYDKQVGQIRRNLYPLIVLLEKIITWLEQSM